MKKWSKYPESISCFGKKQYKDIIAASDAGKIQIYNSGYKLELYIYECPYCLKFHLTQQITDTKV